MLVQHDQGGYAVLRGFSNSAIGVVALPGYEVVRARLQDPLPWLEGLKLIEAYLHSIRRSKHALCGIELRCPEPYSMEDFLDVDRPYSLAIKNLDLYLGKLNPIVRTNVSPVNTPFKTVVLYAFSYTIPTKEKLSNFLTAGAAELRLPKLVSEAIIRNGETSIDAMVDKAKHVIDVMEIRLAKLGVPGVAVTDVNVYTPHFYVPVLRDVILPRLGLATIHEIKWYYAKPPIWGLEFEMDLRGIRKEIII